SVEVWSAPAQGLHMVAFSPDGKTIALSNTRKKKPLTPPQTNNKVRRKVICDLHLLDAKSGKTKATLDGYTGECKSLDFSSSGKMLAVASWRDPEISLWNATTGSLISTLDAHKEGIAALHFSKDENTLVSVGYDCTLKIWDCRQKKTVTTYKLPGPGSHVVNSSDGKLIAFVFDKAFDSSDGSILRVIDRAKMATVMELPLSWGSVAGSISFTPDTKQILLFDGYEEVDFYDVFTGERISTLKPNEKGPIETFAVSSTGHCLAYSHSHDRLSTVTMWDMQRKKELGTIVTSTVLCAITFSPTGKRLVTVGSKSVQMWEVEPHLTPEQR
ncbi:MAG: hypothetical protein KDA84_19630, partial [Planctomycetaceae bacterium]|nr:hypothetical protein [Planctomycetaceae bacterium]